MKVKNEKYKVLGIDVGGTTIKSAFVDMHSGSLISKKIEINTPDPSTPKSLLSSIERIIKDSKWDGDIGLGFPGVIKRGIVCFVGNLNESWIGKNVERNLRKFTTGRVKVINDADAAALAEMQFGAGKKYNHSKGGVILIVTLGTGIGSAVFLNGLLLPNTEFGQIELNGKIAEDTAATIIRENENLSWKKWSKRVNKYLKYMEMILSPDLIIIGGGVSSSPEKFCPYINISTKFVTAEMGNDAGIVGAALAVQGI